MKHICLDKSFYFLLVIIILTGKFNSFLPFLLLLLIHEMGHVLAGILLGYSFDKIVLYPYGGLTKFNLPLNIPIKKELFILVMGPLFQVLAYFLLKSFFSQLYLCHYSLLIFNLLPIYPLDGGKIINACLGIINPYLKSFLITFYFSIIGLFLLSMVYLWHFNLNMLLIIVILLGKLIRIYQKRFYYYQRFLLERYLRKYPFSKIRNVKNIKCFYRGTWHFINGVNESTVLKEYFKKL